MNEDTVPQPDVPEEREQESPQPAGEPSRKRGKLPFGYGLVEDAENGPEPVAPAQASGDKRPDAITGREAYNILPFADAPPLEPEEPAPQTAPPPGETAAPAASFQTVSRAETSPPQPGEAETEDDTTDFLGEIFEYKIVDPPDDDDDDDDFVEILPGPTQEVRFDERPPRRPRARPAPGRARRKSRTRPAPQFTKPAEAPPEKKKKLTPLQVGAILVGAGAALAILIWLVVALFSG